MLLRTCVGCLLGLLGSSIMYAENHTTPSPVHRRAEFAFTASAPYETVAPLFGADKERLWDGEWNPQFLHPQPANDESGAVFTDGSNVWVNTIYDLGQGHIQYVYFTGEAMVTLIDIRIERLTPNTTKATVVYERTALQPEANDHVNQLADHDKTKGPHWEAAIHTYLQTTTK